MGPIPRRSSRVPDCAAANVGRCGTSQRNSKVATKAPASCATMNSGTSAGRIPAKVFDNDRAMVTAGLAKEVQAVNSTQR